jgi:hypothetical protein
LADQAREKSSPGIASVAKSIDFREIIKTKFNDIAAMEGLIAQIKGLSNTY